MWDAPSEIGAVRVEVRESQKAGGVIAIPRSAAPGADTRVSVETVRCDRLRALIKVTGDLDLGTAAPLWAVLDGHVRSGRRFVRLDVSGVTFLDATALTGITQAHRDLLRRRGTLVITGVRSLVARVLGITGLDEVLFVSGPRADDDLPITFAGVLALGRRSASA